MLSFMVPYSPVPRDAEKHDRLSMV